MVVRVYISGISGNKEVKKRQQRVTMILESKNIQYNLIDITEPGKEGEKEFMQEHSKTRNSKHPLPPQIFNDNHYCGDYEEFDMANELDELEKFLNTSSDNSEKNKSENGVTNGSSELQKSESFTVKEDLRESTEENLEVVNDDNTEAVSLDNDIEIESTPIETDEVLDEHESIKDEDDAKIEPEESEDVIATEE